MNSETRSVIIMDDKHRLQYTRYVGTDRWLQTIDEHHMFKEVDTAWVEYSIAQSRATGAEVYEND